MIITFYGKGKGKTSAALGVALRSVGWKRKVKIYQFVKSKDWISGENKVLKKLGVEVNRGGVGFVGICGDKFDLNTHRTYAKKLLEEVSYDIRTSKYDLLILDEVLVAIKLKLLETVKVIKMINSIDKNTDLILTGRPRIEKIILLSDMSSRIDKIKHPFDKRIKAKKGIDY